MWALSCCCKFVRVGVRGVGVLEVKGSILQLLGEKSSVTRGVFAVQMPKCYRYAVCVVEVVHSYHRHTNDTACAVAPSTQLDKTCTQGAHIDIELLRRVACSWWVGWVAVSTPM